MRRRNGTILTGLSLIIILIMFFLVTTMHKDVTDELYESIISLDLTNDYPSTPEDVIKLNNDIMKYLYGGMPENFSEESVGNVIAVQRQLFDKSFLNINPEPEYLRTVLREISIFNENNVKIIGASSGETVYNGADPRRCSITVTTYTDIKDTGIKVYNLVKDSENKWKIAGWTVVGNE